MVDSAGSSPGDGSERELAALIEELRRSPALDSRSIDRILRKHPRNGKGLFSRTQIIDGVRRLARGRGWADEAALLERLRRRPVRTLSGVTPVTVLTRPYPCPGRCIFCPNDVRMPKSYLPDEPGCQRAEANAFDPYLQTWNRVDAYRAMGHPLEKVELIVLGGTWSFYPESYRIWFLERCLTALADYGGGLDRRSAVRPAPVDPIEPAGQTGRASYNQRVSEALRRRNGDALLSAREAAPWERLEAAQRSNEGARLRCVGLSVETRPDSVTEAEVERIRRLGATKVQLGIQSLSDSVLASNRRGHDVSATRRAMGLLRRAGFKLQAHWMPNLHGATPESDLRDFGRLFGDPDFRPDELKIYPCSLIDGTELMDRYRDGSWRPYSEAELRDLLVACLERTPEWCRLTRIVRDIPSTDIVTGNKRTNFREVAQRALEQSGGRCRDIRSREIRTRRFAERELHLAPIRYATSIGDERFLQLVTPDDRLTAFLRLSLPRTQAFLPELGQSALVREVHVYGRAAELREEGGAFGRAQHRGLGRRLVESAAREARAAGYRDLAVISSVGTRPWYRRLGFSDGPLYQHLAL